MDLPENHSRRRLFTRHSRECPNSRAYRPQHGDRTFPGSVGFNPESDCPRCRLLAEQQAIPGQSPPIATASRRTGPYFSSWSPVIGVAVFAAGTYIRPFWLLIAVFLASVAVAWPYRRFRYVVPWSWVLIATGFAAYSILLIFGPPLAAAIFG